MRLRFQAATRRPGVRAEALLEGLSTVAYPISWNGFLSTVWSLSNVFVPDFRIRLNILAQQSDTFRGIEIDYMNAQGAQPFHAALKIPALPDDHSFETELPHHSAAIPTRR